ncbi:MAG TPA: glycosyltransferase family 4 protein [Candidatus Bathyarchaeia archaeon]
MEKTDILVVYPSLSSFIERDIQLLRERYSIATLQYDKRRNRADLLLELRRCRLAFAWFALGYAYPMVRIGMFRGIPTALVAGGYDVESIPELGYGAMTRGVRRQRTRFALANATRVLSVSNFTKGRVLYWCPSANVRVIYHGFPSAPSPQVTKREETVVTVANVRRSTWRLKGLDTFLEVARRIPDASFHIIGRIDEDPGRFGPAIPPNLHVRGWMPHDRLLELFGRSKVYAQLSYVESFGCALAEAMSRGCQPVVTNRGALPEVVGDVTTPVPYGDVDEAEQAVRKGLAREGSTEARDWIDNHFPISDRRRRLYALFQELLP